MDTATATTTMEPGIADIIIRSRHTILDILDDRGYDTTVYRNIAPAQIVALAEGTPRALDIIVPKKPDSAAPCERAVVLYAIQERIRGRLATFTRDLFDESTGPDTIRRDDDIMVILNEQYHEAFDKTSLQMWQTEKVRMVFFHIKQVVVHPGRHVLVPPHRKLDADEAKTELARLHASKNQLPFIKHFDMQARVLGLVPGDVVEVLRPSPTAGIARALRVCVA